VVATDIDLPALAAARQRRYDQRAVRRVPDDLLERYFSFDGQTYRLIPEAAQLVSFAVHNLVRDDRPPGLGNLDIVFCRNVTIYFAEWARDHVNAQLADSLRDGGYLFVASSETEAHNLGRLEPVLTGQILLFQKQQPQAMASSTPSGTDTLSGAAGKGRLFRAPQEQSAGAKARRPLPPSLEELVAQAQDRARAWSKRPPPRQPQEEVLTGAWDPARDHAAVERARTAFQQQDYDAALSELDRLPAGVAVWTEAYCLRSAILIQLERFEEAEAACQTMLAHDPWYADAHFMLGLVFRQQGQVHEAVRSLEQAVNLEPNHPYAHYYLAEIYRGLEQYATARNEYQETLEILEQLDEPASELSLAGLDEDAVRQACKFNLERLADSS
jgi:chemotaxis protein methyltransferase CheR